MIYHRSQMPWPWKVPLREVYCQTFWSWLHTTLGIHVMLRLEALAAEEKKP